MNKKKLEKIRLSLEEQVDNLMGQANETVMSMTDSGENFPDPADRASLESDRSFTLQIRERERKLLGKIRQALERIEDGSFGICEECGEAIEIKRIEARPVTTLCIECKTKQETSEKIRGI